MTVVDSRMCAWPIAMLLGVLVAGCFEGSETIDHTSLRLEDLKECDYPYSDDMYVSCVDEGPTLDFNPGPPPDGGICSFHMTRAGQSPIELRFVWYPQAERLVVHSIPGESLIEREVRLVGGITIKHGDDLAWYHWTSPSEEGHVVLPSEAPIPESPVEDYRMGIVVQGLIWDSAPFGDGEFNVFWEDMATYAHPTVVIDVDRDRYYLPVGVRELGDVNAKIKPILINGEDFEYDLFVPEILSISDRPVALVSPLSVADCMFWD